MRTQRHRPRRAVAVLAVSLLALIATRPARAWEYPLLPHVNALAFPRELKNDGWHTNALLSAYYPNECWQLVDTVRTDSAHVNVTIRRSTGCTDTLSYWLHSFDLGPLAIGMHELTVHCTVLDGDQAPGEEEIRVPFEVEPIASPPPPGPPGPPPSTLPIVEVIGGTEARPGEPVTLSLFGFKPFECTSIHNENASQDSVFMTFEQLASCADSTRRWSRSFDLGTFPEGDFPVAISIFVDALDSDYVYRQTAVVHVHGPQPPPPPVDSTGAGVSSSHPNPFRDQSNLSVSLDDEQFVDVAVFDLLGRRVTTIHHGMLPQGTTSLAWTGRRQDGSRAPGGIYFYRLTLSNRVIHRQVVLLGTP